MKQLSRSNNLKLLIKNAIGTLYAGFGFISLSSLMLQIFFSAFLLVDFLIFFYNKSL